MVFKNTNICILCAINNNIVNIDFQFPILQNKILNNMQFYFLQMCLYNTTDYIGSFK